MSSSRRTPTDPGADIANPQNQARANSISCSECGKEIPPSEAQSAEGEDYMWYFCGLDCFDRWQKRKSPGANAQQEE